MHLTRSCLAAAVGAVLVSCGGSASPSAPVPAATPTPVAVATPTPAPTPSPEPEGEAPVVNTNKPVRITLRLYVVEDPAARIVDYAIAPDGTPIVPVNYKFVLDIVAKDKKNKETRGSGNVIWHWSDDGIVDIENMSNVYHPTLRAAKAGPFCAVAELDEVFSNELCLQLRY